ncbi:MAG: MFS domain-containing histidine kinase [Nitriliruptorales bacterium]|nr:MFS domain-containing histidine kinase [Nitriliruptorales bacterium]
MNLLVAATTSLVAIAFVIPLAFQVAQLAEDRALRPAELATRTLAPAAALQPGEVVEIVSAASAGLDGDVGVVLPDGEQLGAPPPPSLEEHVRRRQRAERVQVPGGVAAVVPVATGDGLAVVHAFVPDAALRRGVTVAWSILALLALTLVGGAVFLADRLARRTLAAIAEVEATAEQLAAGDLRARADVEEPPEVARIADVLGRLAARVRELLVAEREAAADLSHRLRTPLTPLRVDVDALPPSRARDQLLRDVDALETEVSRVIRAFRGSADTAADAPRSDAAAVLEERTRFWAPLAEDQGRTLSVTVGTRPAVVELDPIRLADAIDALLGNVFSHTPEGTALEVELTQEDADFVVSVSDHGPGWPPGVAVTERGASGTRRSTGLGLDIARRAARSCGGALELADRPGGGARVRLRLPRSRDPSAGADPRPQGSE